MYGRLLIILALFVASVAALLPSVSPTWDLPGLPESRLRLGADFLGGSKTVLVVDVESAAHALVVEDIARLGEARPDASFRRVGHTFEVVTDASAQEVFGLVEAHLGGRYDALGRVGDADRFALSDNDIRRIEAHTVLATMQWIRERTWCLEHVRIEDRGQGMIGVEIPGNAWEVCPWRDG